LNLNSTLNSGRSSSLQYFSLQSDEEDDDSFID